MEINRPATFVVTGKVRFSYVRVFTPYAVNEGDVPKFSVTIIIPKKDKTTIEKIKRAIEAAKQEGKNSKFGGKIPANLKNPLHDGDVEKEDQDEFKGCMYMNCPTTRRPQVVDKNKNEILDKDEMYSGCYGRVSLNFFPYANQSKGIGVGLGNLQKMADGEPLGGASTTAEQDFDDLEDDEDDML